MHYIVFYCYAPAALTPSKVSVPKVQEDGWVSEPVWICPKNLVRNVFEPRTVQSVTNRYTGGLCYLGHSSTDKREQTAILVN